MRLSALKTGCHRAAALIAKHNQTIQTLALQNWIKPTLKNWIENSTDYLKAQNFQQVDWLTLQKVFIPSKEKFFRKWMMNTPVILALKVPKTSFRRKKRKKTTWFVSRAQCFMSNVTICASINQKMKENSL